MRRWLAGAALSLLALVVVEVINATSGIGHMITLASNYGQTDIIVVGLVLDVLRSLGSEIDERAESDDPVAEDTGSDALVPPATEVEGARP